MRSAYFPQGAFWPVSQRARVVWSTLRASAKRFCVQPSRTRWRTSLSPRFRPAGVGSYPRKSSIAGIHFSSGSTRLLSQSQTVATDAPIRCPTSLWSRPSFMRRFRMWSPRETGVAGYPSGCRLAHVRPSSALGNTPMRIRCPFNASLHRGSVMRLIVTSCAPMRATIGETFSGCGGEAFSSSRPFAVWSLDGRLKQNPRRGRSVLRKMEATWHFRRGIIRGLCQGKRSQVRCVRAGFNPDAFRYPDPSSPCTPRTPAATGR